jgi:hypothetical protein
MNLIVRGVAEHRTSVFAATIAVSRSTGAALGAQVAAAIVIGAGLAGPGIPADRGFTGAFTLGLVATVVALAATAAMPGRAGDPFLLGASTRRVGVPG